MKRRLFAGLLSVCITAAVFSDAVFPPRISYGEEGGEMERGEEEQREGDEGGFDQNRDNPAVEGEITVPEYVPNPNLPMYEVGISIKGRKKELDIARVGSNINPSYAFSDGNDAGRFLTDGFFDLNRFFVRNESVNDSEYSDGVETAEQLREAIDTVKADPFHNRYINWENITNEVNLHQYFGMFSMGKSLPELARSGGEVMVVVRTDAMVTSVNPREDDYATLWEWWETLFTRCYLMSKNYGVRHYNLMNEANFRLLEKSLQPIDILAALELGADAIRAGAELGGQQAVIYGPTILSHETLREQYALRFDHIFDVWDFHGYSPLDGARTLIREQVTTLENAAGDGPRKKIAISEWNNFYSDNVQVLSNQMSENKAVQDHANAYMAYIMEGAYAPIQYRGLRRTSNGRLIYIIDGTGETTHTTLTYYMFRMIHRMIEPQVYEADYEISGQYGDATVAVTESANNYCVFYSLKSKKHGVNLALDTSAVGVREGKAVVREVSYRKKDEVSQIAEIKDGKIQINGLLEEAIYMVMIPKDHQRRLDAVKIYSASGERDRIKLAFTGEKSALYYRVYRRAEGEKEYTLLADRLNMAMYEDTGVEPGKKYYYQAACVGLGGESPLSGEAGPLSLAPDLYTMPYRRNFVEDPAPLSVVSGKWTRRGGFAKCDSQMYLPDPGSTQEMTYMLEGPEEGWGDIELSSYFQKEAEGTEKRAGYFVKFQDENNYYLCQMNYNNQHLEIIKKKNGVETLLYSETPGKYPHKSNANSLGLTLPARGLVSIKVIGNRLDFCVDVTDVSADTASLDTGKCYIYDDDLLEADGKAGFCNFGDAQFAFDGICVLPAFADDFSDGPREEWKVKSGTWEQKDECFAQTQEQGLTCVTAGTQAWGDSTVSAKAKKDGITGENQALVLYRNYVDPKNHFRYEYYKNRVIAKKVTGGKETVLGEAQGGLDEGIYRDCRTELTVQIDKNLHRVYLDNVLKMTYTCYEPELDAGTVGIGTLDTKADFIDVIMNIDRKTREKFNNIEPELTIPVTQDTMVKSGNSSWYDFSHMKVLRVQEADEGKRYESFLKFDLSALTEPEKIKAANLSLYVVESNSDQEHFASVYPCENTWGKKPITWSSRPKTLGDRVGAIKLDRYQDVWRATDLTEFVRENAGKPEVVLKVMVNEFSQQLSSVDPSAAFASLESGKGPKIDVEFY